MNMSETSDRAPSRRNIPAHDPDGAPSRVADKRPWYIWAGAFVSAGVGAFFFYFFIKMGGLPPNAASLNGSASLLPLAIAPCALLAAPGLVLRRAWASRLLALTGILLLALFAAGALYFLMMLGASYRTGYTVRLMTGMLLMLIALMPALSIGLVYATVRRAGPRFARVAMPIALFLLTLLVWFFSRLV